MYSDLLSIHSAPRRCALIGLNDFMEYSSLLQMSHFLFLFTWCVSVCLCVYVCVSKYVCCSICVCMFLFRCVYACVLTYLGSSLGECIQMQPNGVIRCLPVDANRGME